LDRDNLLYHRLSLLAAQILAMAFQEVRAIRMALESLGKVRTSIPRTKNENFSHLISMGYQ
ncbi:hypothetical protein, partial [Aeromonas caviae]|uniref:hypothetical protein n=1 Tax=Aeromonas caviae TaxID=648 RepID=UPI001CC7FA1A